jgi:hypothetical protein
MQHEAQVTSAEQAAAQQAASQHAAARIAACAPPAIYTSTCHGRGADWIQTTSSGDLTTVWGTITKIQAGIVYLSPDSKKPGQPYDLSRITSMGFGYCK